MYIKIDIAISDPNQINKILTLSLKISVVFGNIRLCRGDRVDPPYQPMHMAILLSLEPLFSRNFLNEKIAL